MRAEVRTETESRVDIRACLFPQLPGMLDADDPWDAGDSDHFVGLEAKINTKDCRLDRLWGDCGKSK